MNYRHRVTFRQDTSTDSEVDPTYTDYLAVPCSVVPVGGGERYRGRQLEAETTTVIETRYYAGLAETMIAVNDVTAAQYTINRIINHEGLFRVLIIEAIEVG